MLLNFTPVPREHYRIGVPEAGFYQEILNTDAGYFGGTDVGNGGGVQSSREGWGDFAHSLSLTVPPLAALVLQKVS